jgi:hypothetical protein
MLFFDRVFSSVSVIQPVLHTKYRYPIIGLDRPLGLQEVRLDTRHMKVASLLALSTGRLYHPAAGDTPCIHFC